MATLRLLSKEGKQIGGIVLLHTDEVTIGRSTDNVLVLPDRSVSRWHARILATPRGYLLVDENSANGLWMGGRRVRHGFLTSGDVFCVGDHYLQFLDENELSDSDREALAQLGIESYPLRRTGALCARCGEPMPTNSMTCPGCGTGVLRPSRRRPMSPALMWTAVVVGLLAEVAGALYIFRDSWTPRLVRLLTGQ